MNQIYSRLKPLKLFFIVLLFSTFLLGACSSEDIVEELIYKEAVNTAEKYYKKSEDTVAIFNDYRLEEVKGIPQIHLYGYDKLNPDKRIEATVEFQNGFKMKTFKESY